MSRRGRAFLSGLAVVILFSLPLLPEIVGARRLVFRDAHLTHWPWRRVAMEMLDSGKAPFVNATASGGQPLLANPNAGLLYPTLLLEKVVAPAAAFNLHYLAHVLWACFGARALASRFGLGEGAAFFAGVAYAFSGAMLSYGSAFANSGPAAAWLPWCAAAVIDVVRAETARRLAAAVAATGIAFGLQLLAGEPAITLLTLLFAGVLAVAGALGAPPGRRSARLGRVAAGGLAAGLLATILAAPLIAPLTQIFRLTYRGQHLYSERAFGASPFAPWRFVEWLFPRFSGDPGALGAGAHWQYAFHPGEVLYLWSVTFGVIPLLAIVLAVARRSFWSSKTALLAATSVITLLFAFGLALPFYRLLYSAEFLRRLRYPIKFYLLTTLCVALLAGFAMEHLSRRRAGALEKIVLTAAAGLFALAFLAAGAGGPLERAVRPRLAEVTSEPGSLLPAILRTFRGDALLGVGAAGLVALLVFTRRPSRGSGYAFGFATLLLALPFGLPLFVSADQKEISKPPRLAPVVAGSGRLYVSPELPQRDVLAVESGGEGPRFPAPKFSSLARAQLEELIPATGAPFGVHYLFDEDPDGSYGWVNRIAGEVLTASRPEERARLLRVFGGRWILAEPDRRYPGYRTFTGLSIAGRHLVLSENRDPPAEVRWASRVHRRTSLSGALELVRSDLFRPATDVVVPGRRAESPGLSALPAKVALRSIDGNGASVDVSAPAPGHLVFSRTWFPGWKATIDGTPARVELANGRDLAVAVGPGTHRVEITWNAAPYRFGILLQAIGLLAALAVAAAERRRGGSTGRPASGAIPDSADRRV